MKKTELLKTIEIRLKFFTRIFCRKLQILAIIKAGYTKFGIKISLYHTQLKLISNVDRDG